MTNTNAAISATSAGHVYLTLAEGTTNSLSDSSSNSDEKADAALFSKVDLTINGKGTLNVDGKKNNGIEANDTLHITGGTYNITAVGDAFNVNDELNITGTTMTIDAKEDGVKVDNDEDTSVGTMYYPTTTSPSQQEMMASTLLETWLSIVVPTPSKIRQKDLKVSPSLSTVGTLASIRQMMESTQLIKTPNRVKSSSL